MANTVLDTAKVLLVLQIFDQQFGTGSGEARALGNPDHHGSKFETRSTIQYKGFWRRGEDGISVRSQ
jgi:hypothetical protein